MVFMTMVVFPNWKSNSLKTADLLDQLLSKNSPYSPNFLKKTKLWSGSSSGWIHLSSCEPCSFDSLDSPDLLSAIVLVSVSTGFIVVAKIFKKN